MATNGKGQWGQFGGMAPDRHTARYVYCVAPVREVAELGPIGIEGRRVYTITHQGLCAAIHDCPDQPYYSTDAEVVAARILAHHRVIEAARRRWGVVLPMTFNTIITSGEMSARENLVAWLGAESRALWRRLEGLAGRSEYGVQLFWDMGLVAREMAGTSPRIRKLQEEIASMPRGVAYMHRQKLETLLREEMEKKGAAEAEALCGRISPWVERFRVDRCPQVEQGRQMLVNLSCLVSNARLPALWTELEEIGRREGFSFCLTGPLPPYSFHGKAPGLAGRPVQDPLSPRAAIDIPRGKRIESPCP